MSSTALQTVEIRSDVPEVTFPEMTAGTNGDGVDGCELQAHDQGPGRLLEPMPMSDISEWLQML